MTTEITERKRRDPGLIVEIFADGRIAVNLGKRAGVTEVTRLFVVRDYDEMRDPQSDKPLGRIMNPKVELSVDTVDDHFCVTYPIVSFGDTIRRALPFMSVDRGKEPRVADEVVFADDWDL